jgi:hypothetical protein
MTEVIVRAFFHDSSKYASKKKNIDMILIDSVKIEASELSLPKLTEDSTVREVKSILKAHLLRSNLELSPCGVNEVVILVQSFANTSMRVWNLQNNGLIKCPLNDNESIRPLIEVQKTNEKCW